MVYHVRITKKSDRSYDLVELDLSKDELLEHIVHPYLKGERFYCDGSIVDLYDIEMIRINFTKEDSTIILPRVKEKRINDSTKALGISDKWYVTNEGKDVTRKFINKPPTPLIESRIEKSRSESNQRFNINNVGQLNVQQGERNKINNIKSKEKSWQDNLFLYIIITLVIGVSVILLSNFIMEGNNNNDFVVSPVTPNTSLSETLSISLETKPDIQPENLKSVLDDLHNTKNLRNLTNLENDKKIGEIPSKTYFYLYPFAFPDINKGNARVYNEELGFYRFEFYKEDEEIFLIGFVNSETLSQISILDGKTEKKVSIFPTLWKEYNHLVILPSDRVKESDYRRISINEDKAYILDAKVE